MKFLMETGLQRRRTTRIVAHCSATRITQDISVHDIDRWHRVERKWAGIGYNLYIKRNGVAFGGRQWDIVGAHVQGHNSTTVGICLEGGVNAQGQGEDNFTDAQKTALFTWCEYLLLRYPTIPRKDALWGHTDFKGVEKFCPSFNAKAYWQSYLKLRGEA